MPNRFAHTELSTTNVQAAKDFYASLFDWQLEDVPSGEQTYTMLSIDGRGIGGIRVKAIAEAPNAWLPYVEVADVRETLAKAHAAGAAIVADYREIGEFGAIGVFLDPTGAALGVWARAKGAPAEADEQPRRSEAEKEARKAEKRARKAAKKAEEKAEEEKRAEEKRARKARKAAEKEAKKALEAELALAAAAAAAPVAARGRSAKRAVKKTAATPARKPAKRRAAPKR